MDGACWWWGPGAFFHGGFGMLVGMTFCLLLVGGGAALLARLVKNGTARDRETPLDVLKRRFAGGEIDQAQFESMRRTLESSS